MVTSTRSDADNTCCYILRPNHSLSWKASKLWFATIAGVVLAVALAFTLSGLWPILPFAGLELAHQRFGSMPWEDLLEPAVRLARDGFPTTWKLHDDFKRRMPRFERYPSSSVSARSGCAQVSPGW